MEFIYLLSFMLKFEYYTFESNFKTSYSQAGVVVFCSGCFVVAGCLIRSAVYMYRKATT